MARYSFGLMLPPSLLVNGLDDIGLTLEKEDAIASYEARNRTEKPWLQKA